MFSIFINVSILNKPFFSIIIATFNSGHLIDNCLNSIITQKENEIEILISDGGSTDNTLSIIQSYAGSISHLRSSPDSGIYDAWNKVLPHVKGEWILFLGSDDRLYSNESLHMAKEKIITQNVKSNYVSFPLVLRDTNSDLLLIRTKKEIVSLLRKGKMGILHPSTLHNRNLFEEFGYFDSTFKIVGDLDFAIRTWESGISVFDSPILTIFALGGVSNNPKSRFLLYSEHKKVLKKHKYYARLPLLLTSKIMYDTIVFLRLEKLFMVRKIILENLSKFKLKVMKFLRN